MWIDAIKWLVGAGRTADELEVPAYLLNRVLRYLRKRLIVILLGLYRSNRKAVIKNAELDDMVVFVIENLARVHLAVDNLDASKHACCRDTDPDLEPDET